VGRRRGELREEGDSTDHMCGMVLLFMAAYGLLL